MYKNFFYKDETNPLTIYYQTDINKGKSRFRGALAGMRNSSMGPP